MRGKAEAAIIGQDMARITPAYAGKRHLHRHFSRLPRDHPRVCGEKQKIAACYRFL